MVEIDGEGKGRSAHPDPPRVCLFLEALAEVLSPFLRFQIHLQWHLHPNEEAFLHPGFRAPHSALCQQRCLHRSLTWILKEIRHLPVDNLQVSFSITVSCFYQSSRLAICTWKSQGMLCNPSKTRLVTFNDEVHNEVIFSNQASAGIRNDDFGP